MKEIVRLHVFDPKLKREVGIMEPDEIVKRLSKPTEDIELDYDEGHNVRMGTSRELIGETVRVGGVGLEITGPL
jgi:hypothetical protein